MTAHARTCSPSAAPSPRRRSNTTRRRARQVCTLTLLKATSTFGVDSIDAAGGGERSVSLLTVSQLKLLDIPQPWLISEL